MFLLRWSLGLHRQQKICWVTCTIDNLLDHTDNRWSVGSHIQQMICWIIHTIHNRWSVGSHRQGSKRVNPKGMREAVINLVAHCSTMMRMMKMDSGGIAWGCIIIISSSRTWCFTPSQPLRLYQGEIIIIILTVMGRWKWQWRLDLWWSLTDEDEDYVAFYPVSCFGCQCRHEYYTIPCHN